MEPLPLWEAAKLEMEEYQFVASAGLQPKWSVPHEIAINVAISGRFSDAVDEPSGHPVSIEDYADAASKVIEAGACGIHVDFSFVTDPKGRRLDRDIPSVEAYGMVLEPLRKRFGTSFVTNLNVLHGTTFDMCMAPARAGLAEVAPCAPGHPEAFMVPAIRALEESGVKPELAVHSSGEIELRHRHPAPPIQLDCPLWATLQCGAHAHLGHVGLERARYGAPLIPHGRPDPPNRPDLGDLRVRGRARNTLRDHARHDDGSAYPGRARGHTLEVSEQRRAAARQRRDVRDGPGHRGASRSPAGNRR